MSLRDQVLAPVEAHGAMFPAPARHDEPAGKRHGARS